MLALKQLFKMKGSQCYIGEKINQLQHALQTVHFGKQYSNDKYFLQACLLHDVGQLIDSKQKCIWGIDNHEHVGANFIRKMKLFHTNVPKLISMHVFSKRYLVTTDPLYEFQLSVASKHTLQIQGGKLNAKQVKTFEQDPLFHQAIWLRKADDLAKNVNINYTWNEAEPIIDFILPNETR